MSTKKKSVKYISPLSTTQCKPSMKPSVNLEQAPPSEAFKRGGSMGCEFMEGFDPEDAADAIAGFREAVASRLASLVAKGERLCKAGQAAIQSLNA